jgi:hypothetical protein
LIQPNHIVAVLIVNKQLVVGEQRRGDIDAKEALLCRWSRGRETLEIDIGRFTIQARMVDFHNGLNCFLRTNQKQPRGHKVTQHPTACEPVNTRQHTCSALII